VRHFLTLVVSTTMAGLSLIGCGSDSDGSPNTGGSGGGSSAAQCVGNNAEFTSAEFAAQTKPDKACSSASDVSTVCQNNMPLIGGQCGKGCLTMGNQAECVASCIQDGLSSTSEPLSQDCLTCYLVDIDCAKTNCLSKCGLDPTSDLCRDCRTDSGCVEEFYACSGLPEPSAP
jgi:hypothetical protein